AWRRYGSVISRGVTSDGRYATSRSRDDFLNAPRNCESMSCDSRTKSSDHPHQYGSDPKRTAASRAFSGSVSFDERILLISALPMTAWSSFNSYLRCSSGAAKIFLSIYLSASETEFAFCL